MKNIIAVLFLLSAFCLQAQHKKLNGELTFDSLKINIPNYDSIMKASEKRLDSINMSSSIQRMNDNSANYFAELSRENERKARQGIWLRIGLGLGFAILGIVGLTRRKKANMNGKPKV